MSNELTPSPRKLALAGTALVLASCTGLEAPPPTFSPVPGFEVCLWTDEGIDLVGAAFANPEDPGLRAEAEAYLDQHLVAHRWGGWIEVKNPILFMPAPLCDSHALDRLVEAAVGRVAHELRFEAEKIAITLEHNGRESEAQQVRASVLGPEGEVWPDGDWMSFLRTNERAWHERQGNLGDAAAAKGHWDWAYYHHSNDWLGSFCLNAIAGWHQRRDANVLRDLTRLERWEDVRAVARPNCIGPFLFGSPCCVEYILGSYAREGRPDLAEAEFAELIAANKPYAAKRLQEARAHWEILQLPPDEAVLRIDELVMADNFEHHARVHELLAETGASGVQLWTDHLDKGLEEWTFSELRLAYVLADTGDPGFGAALERWMTRPIDAEQAEELADLINTWGAGRSRHGPAVGGVAPPPPARLRPRRGRGRCWTDRRRSLSLLERG